MLELVSIHVPKTAGRSFLAVLNSVYDPGSVFHFNRQNYPDKSIPESEQFKTELTEEIKVIHGHFRYSEIADLINSRDTKVIAWLRDPVDRVISNYSFFKKRISLALHDPELQRRKNERLMEYAMLDDTRNLMSKFIEGIGVRNLFFAGITEYFDSELHQLGEMLNWKPFEIPRINDNAEFKSQLPAATDEEKKIIADLNRGDIELYSRAMEIRNKRAH